MCTWSKTEPLLSVSTHKVCEPYRELGGAAKVGRENTPEDMGDLRPRSAPLSPRVDNLEFTS